MINERNKDSPLEERLDTLGLDDLRSGVDHGLVVDLRPRGHHHPSSDGVERVRSKTGTGYSAIGGTAVQSVTLSSQPSPGRSRQSKIHVLVTAHPRANEAAKLPSSGPTRTTGLIES